VSINKSFGPILDHRDLAITGGHVWVVLHWYGFTNIGLLCCICRRPGSFSALLNPSLNRFKSVSIAGTARSKLHRKHNLKTSLIYIPVTFVRASLDSLDFLAGTSFQFFILFHKERFGISFGL